MPQDHANRKRRPYGDGSVYKREDGYWAGAFYAQTVSGARKRVVVYGKSLKEVRDKLAKAQQQARSGIPVPDESWRLGIYLEHWLENFVKRYVILEDDEGSFRELLEMTSQQQRIAPREEAPVPKEQGLKALVRGLKDEAEMEAIADALEKTNWCRKDAAKMLGISYKALLYKMRQFNLDSGRGSRSAAEKEAKAAAAKAAAEKDAAKDAAPTVLRSS